MPDVSLPAMPSHWLYVGAAALMALYALFMWAATVFRRKRTVILTRSSALDELNASLGRIATALETIIEIQRRPGTDAASPAKHSIPLSMFGREM